MSSNITVTVVPGERVKRVSDADLDGLYRDESACRPTSMAVAALAELRDRRKAGPEPEPERRVRIEMSEQTAKQLRRFLGTFVMTSDVAAQVFAALAKETT